MPAIPAIKHPKTTFCIMFKILSDFFLIGFSFSFKPFVVVSIISDERTFVFFHWLILLHNYYKK